MLEGAVERPRVLNIVTSSCLRNPKERGIFDTMKSSCLKYILLFDRTRLMTSSNSASCAWVKSKIIVNNQCQPSPTGGDIPDSRCGRLAVKRRVDR